MQNNPDTLDLSLQTDLLQNLLFLLRLSNYRTAHITDAVEAFNYLVQRQLGTNPTNLLLIADPSKEQPFQQLLDERERCGVTLPILLTYAEDEIRLARLKIKEALKVLISQYRTNRNHAGIQDFSTEIRKQILRCPEPLTTKGVAHETKKPQYWQKNLLGHRPADDNFHSQPDLALHRLS